MSATSMRGLTGVFGAAAALLIWVIAVPVLNVELTATAQGQQIQVGPVQIIVFSIIPALLGWALIVGLERFAAGRAKAIWTIIAASALLLSLVPLTQLSASAAVSLGLMHLVVGTVIIVVMRSTSKVASAYARL